MYVLTWIFSMLPTLLESRRDSRLAKMQPVVSNVRFSPVLCSQIVMHVRNSISSHPFQSVLFSTFLRTKRSFDARNIRNCVANSAHSIVSSSSLQYESRDYQEKGVNYASWRSSAPLPPGEIHIWWQANLPEVSSHLNEKYATKTRSPNENFDSQSIARQLANALIVRAVKSVDSGFVSVTNNSEQCHNYTLEYARNTHGKPFAIWKLLPSSSPSIPSLIPALLPSPAASSSDIVLSSPITPFPIAFSPVPTSRHLLPLQTESLRRVAHNVTHTDSLAGCAVSFFSENVKTGSDSSIAQSSLDSEPTFNFTSFYTALGLDAELIDRDRPRDLMKFARRRMTSVEVRQLESLSKHPIAQRRLFLCLWTAKEAIVKAFGTGIASSPGLRGFEILVCPPYSDSRGGEQKSVLERDEEGGRVGSSDRRERGKEWKKECKRALKSNDVKCRGDDDRFRKRIDNEWNELFLFTLGQEGRKRLVEILESAGFTKELEQSDNHIASSTAAASCPPSFSSLSSPLTMLQLKIRLSPAAVTAATLSVLQPDGIAAVTPSARAMDEMSRTVCETSNTITKEESLAIKSTITTELRCNVNSSNKTERTSKQKVSISALLMQPTRKHVACVCVIRVHGELPEASDIKLASNSMTNAIIVPEAVDSLEVKHWECAVHKWEQLVNIA